MPVLSLSLCSSPAMYLRASREARRSSSRSAENPSRMTLPSPGSPEGSGSRAAPIRADRSSQGCMPASRWARPAASPPNRRVPSSAALSSPAFKETRSLGGAVPRRTRFRARSRSGMVESRDLVRSRRRTSS